MSAPLFFPDPRFATFVDRKIGFLGKVPVKSPNRVAETEAMLKHRTLSSLNVDTPPAPPRTITGQYLARNQLNARARAQLAADIIAGQAEIDTSSLTIKQIATICRTNAVYLNDRRFPHRVKRRQQKKFASIFDAIGRMLVPKLAGRLALSVCGPRLLLRFKSDTNGASPVMAVPLS